MKHIHWSMCFGESDGDRKRNVEDWINVCWHACPLATAIPYTGEETKLVGRLVEDYSAMFQLCIYILGVFI